MFRHEHLQFCGLKLKKYISNFHRREVVGRASETHLLSENYFFLIQWFNPYSAGIDFSRQNLTSVDVRF